VTDTLSEGQKLEKGQSITSANGAYTLTLHDDGNLVLAARGQAVWATGTNGQDVVRAEVQTDGNFVLYTPDQPVWASDTLGKKDVKLVMQDDRNVGLYAADGPAWSSNTNTDEQPPPAPEAAAPEVAPEPVSAAEEASVPEPDSAHATPPPAPESAPAPEPPAPEPAVRTYTVESGDTLWAISERFYGDGSRYLQIADASGISNPDLIEPGQVLTIP